ncbi:MAG TPA: polysaccharide biosynthesis/export family protein [Planctomycetota bacterium]
MRFAPAQPFLPRASISAFVLACVAAFGCARSPVLDGPTLGPNPGLLGPNVTDEIARGEFFLGMGDEVEITMWRHGDLSRTYTVGASGAIHPFQIGKLDVQGKTLDQVRAELESGYARYYRDASLDIKVTPSPMRKVTVLGQVMRPGVYPLARPGLSVIDLIATAGGVAPDGETTGVVVAREIDGVWQTAPYSLDEMFEPSDLQSRVQVPYVQPGDYLYVVRTSLAEFGDYMNVITNSLRALTLTERAIILQPRVSDSLLNQ